METQDPHTRAPVVAAFDAAAGVREPVEFGIAAADVTGAPLIVAVVQQGGPVVRHVVGELDEGDEERSLRHLREDLRRRRIADVEIRTFEDRTAARGLARALELRIQGKADDAVYRVHGRFGEPCPRCGETLRRVDFEEHTITYCPAEQTGGRILKDRRLSRLLR